jgi:hypothetical protein
MLQDLQGLPPSSLTFACPAAGTAFADGLGMTNTRRFVQLALTAAGILLVAVALAAVGDRPAPAAATSAPQSVIVRNDTVGETVPTTVQGPVTVQGAVALTAGQQVGVSGTVTVGNGDTNAVPVRVVEEPKPQTRAFAVDLPAEAAFGETQVFTNGTSAFCSDGEPMITDLTITPSTGNVLGLTSWGALLGSTDQPTPIQVAGQGPHHVTFSIPGGLPAQSPLTLVILRYDSPLTTFRFTFWITYYCGGLGFALSP